jgi:hypothetical protein
MLSRLHALVLLGLLLVAPVTALQLRCTCDHVSGIGYDA